MTDEVFYFHLIRPSVRTNVIKASNAKERNTRGKKRVARKTGMKRKQTESAEKGVFKRG